MGGYCYINNAAVAARRLSGEALRRVAVLDVDYHAGNGTQDIFYARPEVLTVSLHADPSLEYPYHIGYPDETGAGDGAGLHLNIPLAVGTGDAQYLQALAVGAEKIRAFQPEFLVVSFGADTFVEDPMGFLAVTQQGFGKIGESIQALGLPTVLVFEGGYAVEQLGENVFSFLSPFIQAI